MNGIKTMLIDHLESLCQKSRLGFNFPATLLFNEGWMLRVLMDCYYQLGITDTDLSFPKNGRWFSEIMLPSPFSHTKQKDEAGDHTKQKDEAGESSTHADGIIGNFEIRKGTKAGIIINKPPVHLVILEAKMFSKLSARTKAASSYNQAARNVACIAQLVYRDIMKPKNVSKLSTIASDFSKLAFYVIAPDEKRGAIVPDLDPKKIIEAISMHPNKNAKNIRDIVSDMLDNKLIDIKMLSWECAIKKISLTNQILGDKITSFYNCCLCCNNRSSQIHKTCKSAKCEARKTY